MTFPDQNGIEHVVTISIGGVVLHGESDSFPNIYRQADKTLYRAKADGKNRYIIEPYHATQEA